MYVLGLNVQEVHKCKLESNPGSVARVQLPLRVLPCTVDGDGVDIGVDRESYLDPGLVNILG